MNDMESYPTLVLSLVVGNDVNVFLYIFSSLKKANEALEVVLRSSAFKQPAIPKSGYLKFTGKRKLDCKEPDPPEVFSDQIACRVIIGARVDQDTQWVPHSGSSAILCDTVEEPWLSLMLVGSESPVFSNSERRTSSRTLFRPIVRSDLLLTRAHIFWLGVSESSSFSVSASRSSGDFLVWIDEKTRLVFYIKSHASPCSAPVWCLKPVIREELPRIYGGPRIGIQPVSRPSGFLLLAK